MATRLRTAQRGQSLVEFALGAILLFTLVFGIVEMGRLMYSYSVVASAAREGARKGAIEYSQSAVEAAVRDRAVAMDLSRLEIAPIQQESGQVVVVVTYEFVPVTPLISALAPSVSLGSEARQFQEVMP